MINVIIVNINVKNDINIQHSIKISYFIWKLNVAFYSQKLEIQK
jgi:hypothetical protein